jgi:hypothetical protein
MFPEYWNEGPRPGALGSNLEGRRLAAGVVGEGRVGRDSGSDGNYLPKAEF